MHAPAPWGVPGSKEGGGGAVPALGGVLLSFGVPGHVGDGDTFGADGGVPS